MPIMSAVTAGALPNKRRIHTSQSPLQYRIGLEFVVDNGSTIDLNDHIDGLTVFPHLGARTFTLGTPVFDSGVPEGTPLTRAGDVLTLNTIPFAFSGGVSFGTGSVLVTVDLAGTHDFDPVLNVNNFNAPLQLVHDASDSVFNGGTAVMRFDGSVLEYICPVPFGGDRCSNFIPTEPSPGFENPSLTIGSAVSTVEQSPFAGGGNSYSFISSVNSFIDTPASSDWAVGTGDFTIEWFSYQTTLSGFQRAFTVDDFASIDIGSSIESGTFYYWANNSFRYSSSSASTANVWIHWAIVRASGITKVYKNGTQLGSQITDTNNITNTVDELTIGNENTATTTAALVGYLTNFRWVKGLAVYTGNFTVPTSVLTAEASANPYGGANTAAVGAGFTKLLLVP